MSGLDRVDSHGDGYSISMHWFQAYPEYISNKIAYHIYYSTAESTVFHEGVKYIIIDGSLSADIIDLTPGQDYWFSVRPVEYDPTIITFLPDLPIAYHNIRFYPTNILRENIGPTDLLIPLLSVEEFTQSGIIKIGVELISYFAIDSINNTLMVSPAGSITGAHLLLQSNSQYYIPGTTNTGQGTITSLTLVSASAQNEIWTIRCIANPIDDFGNQMPARFETIGSVSGNIVDQYGNFPIWQSNGVIVSNGVLSFAITETILFKQGDYFTMQTVGALPGGVGGRGFNDTPITLHTVSGFDGYNCWSPIVGEFAIEEDAGWDQIYACQSRFEYPHFPFTVLEGYHQVPQDYLSTDYTAADAANVTFPEYDYSGWHRTDPVLLLNGTCVGSYIGGDNGCIDQLGNNNRYRGLNLEMQNTQRQDVLLSVTGQPAVLIKRQQTGITCSCYLTSSEYQDDRCPFCFVGGTLVRTENGYKPIEDIKIGEKVLSSDGFYHNVLRVFERQYDGMLQSITSSIGANPILATLEHPFMAMRGSHNMEMSCGPNSGCKAFIARGDGVGKSTPSRLPSGKWWARAQLKGQPRISLGSFITEKEAEQAIYQYKKDGVIPGHMLDWDDAKNISKGDWLVAKWSDEISDIDMIEIPVEFRKNTKLGEKRLGPNQFIVDEEFLWVVGMYLAEGSNNKRSISFSLHVKETNFSDRLVAYFNKQGYHPAVYKSAKTNGMVVEVHSTTLAKWFPKWLGKLCNNKHIPEELMTLPNNKSWAIINGIYDGDGTKREHGIGQTSEILALQLVELLHRVGERPLLIGSDSPKLTEKGNKRKRCYYVNWGEDTLTNHNRKGRWDYNGHLLSTVRKSEQTKYIGKVYNLEVEGDHTYVVQGVVTHNCYGTKFVFGYEQYFNPRSSDGRIKVRLDPTAENLKMYEAGLESEFPLGMWTLTVPTIKTRDVLILFDQDDNESFRYEVAAVTRNNIILGLDGGQHLATFRIRKTDPAYQIRTFKNTSDFPQTLNTSLGFAPGLPPHSHTVRRSEKILSVSQINQTTGISQGHSHPVINGKIMEVLQHSHKILLP